MAHLAITNTCAVFRLQRTGVRDAYGATPLSEGLDVTVIPAGTDIVAVYGGNSALALYEIFCHEPVTLRNGDKLKDGDREWIVRGTAQPIDNQYMHYTHVIGEAVL